MQLAHPDGTVTYLADDGFHVPNDLAVAFDGAVYFTDPGTTRRPRTGSGRVMRLAPDGTVAPVATGFWYCNGIAFEPDGTLVVVERRRAAAGPSRRHTASG